MKFTEMLDIPHSNVRIMGFSAILTLGCMLASMPVLAQEQDAPDQSTDQEAVLEEVIVSGTRRALQNSIDIKRDATGIVDALSIGDIGDIAGHRRYRGASATSPSIGDIAGHR